VSSTSPPAGKRSTNMRQRRQQGDSESSHRECLHLRSRHPETRSFRSQSSQPCQPDATLQGSRLYFFGVLTGCEPAFGRHPDASFSFQARLASGENGRVWQHAFKRPTNTSSMTRRTTASWEADSQLLNQYSSQDSLPLGLMIAEAV